MTNPPNPPEHPDYPFAAMAHDAAAHFRLCYYGAVLRVITLAADTFAGIDPALERFPFLRGYVNELAEQGLDGVSMQDAPGWWENALLDWEQASPRRLPLAALRAALHPQHDAILLLVATGLAEEDGRFVELFRALHGVGRPTVALLATLAGMSDPADPVDARPLIRELVAEGLLHASSREEAFPTWTLGVPDLLWEAMRGDAPPSSARWLRHRPTPPVTLAQMLPPPSLRRTLERLPALLASGDIGGVLVRGPRHNGRRSLLAALAAETGCGTLELYGLERPDDERWRLVGPLATLLAAMPVVVADLAPSDTLRLPRLTGYGGPLGVVLGHYGGVDTGNGERYITIKLALPDLSARRRHWNDATLMDADVLAAVARSFRLSGGSIRRAAGLARTYASLAGRDAVGREDVREATRALSREVLDNLAVRESARGDWDQLVCGDETRQELATLEARCRQREDLAQRVGPALSNSLNAGVRALLKGPSGTGKTLAARVLANVLGMDLYRVDLSAVVNKYIGETEKNLHRIFSRAEELDVMLLFDEGDALLGRRTNVQTANDRYANLETNFLLQRIESHEGIVLITSNAAEHIDTAFQRRMDVVIEFRAPGAAERLDIWQLHLPPQHGLPEPFLDEVAQRCALTGGQIRNAVLHAALLSASGRGRMAQAHLESAIRREYRKLGTVCPLRQAPRLALSGI